MSPITTAIPPPRISAGGWPLSRLASIRTPAPSPTASGSKITSTLTKKNYASQIRRGLDTLYSFPLMTVTSPNRPTESGSYRHALSQGGQLPSVCIGIDGGHVRQNTDFDRSAG